MGKYEVYILAEIFFEQNKEFINEVYEKIKNISKNYIVICAEHATNFGREDIEIIKFIRKEIVQIGQNKWSISEIKNS